MSQGVRRFLRPITPQTRGTGFGCRRWEWMGVDAGLTIRLTPDARLAERRGALVVGATFHDFAVRYRLIQKSMLTSTRICLIAQVSNIESK